MTKDEALKLALDALEPRPGMPCPEYESLTQCAITAIREALAQPEQDVDWEKLYRLEVKRKEALAAKYERDIKPLIKIVPMAQPEQDCNHCGGTGDVSGEYPGVGCPECNGSGVQVQPEFIKHAVENAEDWSEWVCPDPQSYLMKCCDCGLVHEAQFRVAKYQPKPSEDFIVTDDPDLQAQFRMRRNEQWSPKDTAYRPGGLAQPEQEPVAWHHPECKGECIACLIQRAVQDAYGTQGLNYLLRHVTPVATPPRREWVGLTEEEFSHGLQMASNTSWMKAAKWVEAKLREKNGGGV